MGKYPVTQEQYSLLRGGKNPSKSTKDPKCPVDNVSVENARLFCSAASSRTGKDVRLPSEAEWEYSSRGSTQGRSAQIKWFWGDDPSKLPEYAICKLNSDGHTHPVGTKLPNPFGLYDIYGNVTERVNDTYKRSYYEETRAARDPKGPSQGMNSNMRFDNVPIPEDGDYALTAKVCTVTNKQRLTVSTSPCKDEAGECGNDDDDGTGPLVLELPYTMGEWEDSTPVVLKNLKQGSTTLYFWRDKPPAYGVTVKEFTLTHSPATSPA